MKTLKEIFERNKCDKASHHYYEVYEGDLEWQRNSEKNILEVGIWKGTSHQSWLEYMPNVQAYGIDIFTRMQPEDVPVLKEDRMSWIKADSTNQRETWDEMDNKWNGEKFDIIIDDGLHTPRANADTFNTLMPMLKPDGIYYIEDVWPLNIMTESEWKHSWIKQHPDRYNKREWDYFTRVLHTYNENIEPIDFDIIDLRKKSGKPDSVIVKIVKA